MSDPLVSVIIPTYNSVTYLPAAIESALEQTYSHKEIIVINDGSTDNTRSVAQFYKGNILYFEQHNKGPASARNLGIRKSKGDFIAFLDADDLWFPDKIKMQIEFFKKNPEYGLIHTNTWIMKRGKLLHPAFVYGQPPSGHIFESLFMQNHINNLTVMVKRECLESTSGFDENRDLIGIEDYDLWLRISLNYKIGYLDKILSVYRIHDANISDEDKLIKSNLHIIDKFRKNLDSSNKKFQKLLLKKEHNIQYRWACNVIEKKNYQKAKKLFFLTLNGKGLKIASFIGIISCILKNNIFLKSRRLSLKYTLIGDYYNSLAKADKAKHHYFKAIKLYPIRKRPIERLFGIYIKKIKDKLR